MIQRLLFEGMYWLGFTPWDTGITPPEVETFLESHPPGRALDLGCGTGTNVLYMARRGWQVAGVDWSARAIRLARRKARRAGLQVDLHRGDVTRLQGIVGPFDLALDIGCYHSLPLPGQQRYAERLAELVRPQGTYLLYTWLRDDESPEERPPSEGEVRAAFEPAFEMIKLEHGSDRHRKAAWFTFQRRA